MSFSLRNDLSFGLRFPTLRTVQKLILKHVTVSKWNLKLFFKPKIIPLNCLPGDEGEAQAHPAHDVRPAHRERRPLPDVLGPDRVEVQARVQNLKIREEGLLYISLSDLTVCSVVTVAHTNQPIIQ